MPYQRTHTRWMRTTAIGLIAAGLLSGCNAADRLSRVGKAPEMAQIENPTTKRGYQPVSMPMPLPEIEDSPGPLNSLWSGDKKGFFEDQRATQTGDILTVLIEIDDRAEMENESTHERNSSEDADLNSLLGYEGALADVLPEAVDNTDLINLGSASSHTGTGEIDREEQITVRLAVTVTQILPNGNMVVNGRQEVRVNFEKRILELVGIIRPEDITIDNTISYDKIAEARISYGGEGLMTDVQQPRYGQQVYDILFPF